ncbi:hypothetical protein V1477_015920, partial [Vespula maculifrons]
MLIARLVRGPPARRAREVQTGSPRGESAMRERSRPFQTRKHEFCVLLSRSFLRSFESTSHRTEVLRIVITKVYLWDSGVTETVYYVSSPKNPRCLFLESDAEIRCLRDDTVSALSLQSWPLRSHRVKCAIILVNSEQLAVIKHRKPSQVADNDTPDVLSKSSAPANDFDIAVCVGDSCLRIGGKPSSFELGNGGWKGEKGEKVHAYGTYRVYGMTVELYKDEKLMPWWAAERQARIGFCPNPQSLRALMTARHDPPGKILAIMEHATSNMQLKVNGTGSRTDPRDSKRSILEARVKTDSRDVFNETLGPSCVSLVSFREKDRGQSVCTCTILPQQVPLCLFRGNMSLALFSCGLEAFELYLSRGLVKVSELGTTKAAASPQKENHGKSQGQRWNLTSRRLL